MARLLLVGDQLMQRAPTQSHADAPHRPSFATPPYALSWTPAAGVPAISEPLSSRARAWLASGSWGVMPPIAMVFGALMAVVFHFGFVVSPPRIAFAREAVARAAAAFVAAPLAVEEAKPVKYDALPPDTRSKAGPRTGPRGAR